MPFTLRVVVGFRKCAVGCTLESAEASVNIHVSSMAEEGQNEAINISWSRV